MKVSLRLSMVVSLALIASLFCGGCGSDSPAAPSFSLSSAPSIQTSITAFSQVIPAVATGASAKCACADPIAPCACSCPGGGSVSVRAADDGSWFMMSFEDCASEEGLLFSGDMEGVPDEKVDASLDAGDLDYNRKNTIITYDFQQFGSCTEVTGTIVLVVDQAEGTDTCQGTLHAVCDGEAASCAISADCTFCQ